MIETVTEATQEQVRAVAVEVMTVSDLPDLSACAFEFASASKFIGDFKMEQFCRVWTELLSGSGIIFGMRSAGGDIVGMLGGIQHKDLYSERLIASEFFWFVRDGYRGRGIDLYRAFEQWARDAGCVQIRMVHLIDSMPEKLNHVYRRLGFEPSEVHFTKELA